MDEARSSPRWRRPLTWPARWLNGAGVALGVALVHAMFGALTGDAAAQAAVSGAVCASLPDTPLPPTRTWRRVLPAVLIVAAVTAAVGLVRHQPWAMGGLVMLIAGASQMLLSWGPRAGALSFTGTLAMVFAMAGETPPTAQAAWLQAGWTLAGGLAYAAWAQALSWIGRRRQRELAVAEALRATAARMRSRADRVDGRVAPAADSIRLSIRDDATLAEALQAARDHVFGARASPHMRRLAAVVLRVVELRDGLLSSRLDLPLLGDDATARAWRAELALTLRQQAGALDALADGVAERRRPPPGPADPAEAREQLRQRLLAIPAPEADRRRVLALALGDRLGHVVDDIAAIRSALQAEDAELPLEAAALARFVSPEGYPLAALQAQLSLSSGVLRHALRSALAVGAAWSLALALPWAAHPHWLVLSVAVVLRGSLEQTLARRNDRLLGTVLGCLLVAGLAALHRPAWLPLLFLLAVGTAHVFAVQRYLVTATAATLMALLQPLLVDPGSAPAVVERLADTALGAALAWAACFVWPSWERHTMRRLSRQLQGALQRHAERVLTPSTDEARQVLRRLDRAQAYALLGQLAAAAQRNAAEPARVRLPEAEVDAVLQHAWRLMALLGTVGQSLQRRGERLDRGRIDAALQATRQALARPQAAVATSEPDWPDRIDPQDLTPWVLRRLQAVRDEAAALEAAAARLDAY